MKPFKQLMLKHLSKTLKNIENEGKISYLSDTIRNPLSTGLLSLDEFFQGGLFPGFYTFAGMAQSGKSLISISLLASAFKQQVPLLVYFDAEDSLNETVATNVFKTDFPELVKLPKTGVPPIQCFRGNSLEGVMDAITSLVNDLPDKIFIEEENSWYYKLPKDKNSNDLIEALDLEVDETLAKKYPKFFMCKDNNLSADDSAIQALIIIDSLAILLSDKEDEETSGQMGIEARLFSKHLKRFIGKLNRKRIIIVGVNQLRENPMDMYKPEYEPGGKAIEFYALVRTWLASVSVSTAKWKSGVSGAILEEENAFNTGKDRYMFKRFKLTKDKVGGKVNSTIITRVWIEGSLNEAGGFCAALDTYSYLERSGKLDGNKKQRVPLHPVFKDLNLTFEEFKRFVLAEAYEHLPQYKALQETLVQEYKLAEFPRLRQWCFGQLNKELKDYKVVNIVDTNSSVFLKEPEVGVQIKVDEF